MNRRILATTTLLIGFAATAQAQYDMIGSTWTGDVYQVDSTMTNAPVMINSVGTNTNAMTRTPSGTIYVAGGGLGSNDLYSIDPTTGNATNLGSMGVNDIRGMAANSDGTLHLVLNGSPDSLWSFDIGTMTPTSIGPTNYPGIQGLSFGPGGILYAMDIGSGSGFGDGLITLDLTTGAGTDVNAALGNSFPHQFLAWDGSSNLLYAGSNIFSGEMVSIDPNTSIESPLGQFFIDIRGCDFTSSTGPSCLGQNFECPATVLNSSGSAATICATGSLVAANNNLTLTTTGMPTINPTFGYFLNSTNQNPAGFVPPGSVGRLCVGPQNVGRYNQPGNVFNASGTGEGSITLNLTMTPTPTGNVAIVAGQTWYFTTWFRDQTTAGPTSNFSDAVCITFQ